METLEELKAIVESAPDGATHYSDTINGFKSVQHYMKYDNGDWFEWYDSSEPNEWDYCGEDAIGEFNGIHSLSDIKRIIELMEFKQQIESLIRESDGVVGYPQNKGVTFWGEIL